MKKRKDVSETGSTSAEDFAVESPFEEVPKKIAGKEGGGEVEKPGVREEEISIEELKQRLDEKKKESEEMYDRLLRATADFENFKKRSEREKLDRIKFANEELMKELLPVVDNLERALASSESTRDTEAIKKGIGIVLDQVLKTLQKFGLSGYTSVGETFDPNRHEAVEQVESTEHEANTILDEFQKGYFLNGRLLRPALVSVTRHPDESASSD
jgi:molecular chaperone GrpE